MALRPVTSTEVLDLWRAVDEETRSIRDLVTTPDIVTATLAVGNNTIAHRLGKLPRGWEVVDRTAATTLYRVSWTTKHIVLNSSAAATVGLKVF